MRRVRPYLLAALALALGYGLGAAILSAALSPDAADRPPPSPLSVPDQSRSELVLIYLGKASCRWCTHPATQSALRDAKDSLELIAARRDLSFVSVGISLDYDTERGHDHLSDLGEFDEIGLGMNWLNSYALRFFWGDMGGEAATPHVVVLRRDVRQNQANASFAITREDIVARKVGYLELLQWRDAGFRITLPPPDQGA